jgi:hypothetical protein
MIWFDAVLNEPAGDGMLRHGVAAMLGVAEDKVKIVHHIEDIDAAAITCVVEDSTAVTHPQLITFYLPESFPSPAIPESAARLAAALGRSMLLPDDATANPYSFVQASAAGKLSVVLVDPDQLDERGRYVIREASTEAG